MGDGTYSLLFNLLYLLFWGVVILKTRPNAGS
jgi:hypothetical protein